MIATTGTIIVGLESLENSRRIAERAAELTAADAEIRLWDLSTRQRGDSFESIMDAIQSAFDAAGRGDEAEMRKQLSIVRRNLLKVEHLVEKGTARALLWKSYEQFAELCSQSLNAGKTTDSERAQLRATFEGLRTAMHDQLDKGLFDLGKDEFDPMAVLRKSAERR